MLFAIYLWGILWRALRSFFNRNRWDGERDLCALAGWVWWLRCFFPRASGYCL